MDMFCTFMPEGDGWRYVIRFEQEYPTLVDYGVVKSIEELKAQITNTNISYVHLYLSLVAKFGLNTDDLHARLSAQQSDEVEELRPLYIKYHMGFSTRSADEAIAEIRGSDASTPAGERVVPNYSEDTKLIAQIFDDPEDAWDIGEEYLPLATALAQSEYRKLKRRVEQERREREALALDVPDSEIARLEGEVFEKRLAKISHSATTGDDEAIKTLMNIAEDLYEEEKYKVAAKVFEDAARCHRINTARVRTYLKAELTHIRSELAEKSEQLQALKSWLVNSKEFHSLVAEGQGLSIDLDLVSSLLRKEFHVVKHFAGDLEPLSVAMLGGKHGRFVHRRKFELLIVELVQEALGEGVSGSKLEILLDPPVGVLFVELIDKVKKLIPEYQRIQE